MKFVSWGTFFAAAGGTAVIAVIFAALPVFADVDLHTDEYCLYSDGKQVRANDGYGCQLDWRIVFDRYLAWLGIAATAFYTAFAIVTAWIAVDRWLGRRRSRRLAGKSNP